MKNFFQKGLVLTLVLLAVVSTLFLLVYKMNQKDDMGEVPVVVVDGEKDKEVNIKEEMGEAPVVVVDSEKDKEVNILDRYYNGRMGEWPMDAVDQIEVSDGFTLVTSLMSHKGDKIVYYETDGENANVVILDLESKEKVVMEDVIYKELPRCVTYEYLPSRWSVNDKKIIREGVYIEGGCSAGISYAYILDVDSLEEEVFMNHYSYIILEDDKRIVYFTDSNTYCRAMGNIFDGIVVKNIETGEILKVIEGENKIYNSLQMNEDHEVVFKFNEVSKNKNLSGCYDYEYIGDSFDMYENMKEEVLELE